MALQEFGLTYLFTAHELSVVKRQELTRLGGGPHDLKMHAVREIRAVQFLAALILARSHSGEFEYKSKGCRCCGASGSVRF